ncbi:MAG: hypothetical protein J1E97_05535 [Muribaculaceae bacterium]|nr:hypothetical protein [Muribaculaceae bacterium]
MKLMTAYKSSSAAPSEESLKVMVWPDSAVVKTGKPVFIDFDISPLFVPAIGVKIKAVGKSVQPRFAGKYFSEVAPMIYILQADVAQQIASGLDPKGCDIVADYSVIEGDPVEIGADAHSVGFTFSHIKTDGTENCYDFSLSLKELHDAISVASRRNTLKTGDFVAVLSPLCFESARNNVIKVVYGDDNTLISNILK